MFDRWKLKQRMDSMENTLQKLQGGFQTLELEWINAYAKLTKIVGRMAKQTSALESMEKENSQAAPGESSSPADAPGGRLLTPRQLQIQQSILRRRSGAA